MQCILLVGIFDHLFPIESFWDRNKNDGKGFYSISMREEHTHTHLPFSWMHDYVGSLSFQLNHLSEHVPVHRFSFEIHPLEKLPLKWTIHVRAWYYSTRTKTPTPKSLNGKKSWMNERTKDWAKKEKFRRKEHTTQYT